MSDVKVRVEGPGYYYEGEHYWTGDTLTVPEECIEKNPQVLVPVSDTDEDTDSDSQDEEYTCVGNDGECSRAVDEEGGRCWQHEE